MRSRALAPEALGRVLETGDNDGTPYVVTEMLAGNARLRDWVHTATAAVQAGPDRPARQAPTREFTRAGAWRIPVAQPKVPPLPPALAPSAPTVPSAPPTPAQEPGEFTRKFQAPAPQIDTGEFGAPATQEPPPEKAPAPPAPESPTHPAGFTGMFGSPAAPAGSLAVSGSPRLRNRRAGAGAGRVHAIVPGAPASNGHRRIQSSGRASRRRNLLPIGPPRRLLRSHPAFGRIHRQFPAARPSGTAAGAGAGAGRVHAIVPGAPASNGHRRIQSSGRAGCSRTSSRCARFRRTSGAGSG